MKTTNSKLGKMVDELGLINAAIAKLEKQAGELKEVLKGQVGKKIDGEVFSATIIEQESKRLDTAWAEAHFTECGITPEYKYSKSVQVRLRSLKG